jgi:hypothetical protein
MAQADIDGPAFTGEAIFDALPAAKSDTTRHRP